MASVLNNTAFGLKKFGDGDCVNAPRVLKLIEPTGLCLSVAISLPERSHCVDALFKLLGSEAFRKDEEIGLAIGEALATFSEAYKTLDFGIQNWPMNMDESFARNSPPPTQVRSKKYKSN